MNGALLLALLLSLALNVASLRWAFHEHAGRRQWQQEAAVLARTLRSAGSAEMERAGSTWPWLWMGLVGAGFLLVVLLFLLNVTGL